MKKMLLLGIAAVSIAAAAPAQAALNMNGVTGVVNSPTAQAPAPMTLSVAGDYVNSEDFMLPLRVNFAVMEGLEIGGVYSYVDSDAIDGEFGVGAKYTIPIMLAEGLDIAVGGRYQMTMTDDDDISTLLGYGVASYGMGLEGVSFLASAGAEVERMSNGDSETGVGFFANLEVGIEALEGFAVAAEFTSDHGDIGDDSTSVLVRYALPMVPGLTVQAGLTEVGDDHEFFVGAQFAFGAL